MRAHKASLQPNRSTLSPHNHPTDRGDSPQIGHTQKLVTESFRCSAPSDQHVGAQNQSHRAPQHHAATARFTLVARRPFRPARFSHDSNILRKYGTEGAGHLRYSPLINACTGVSHGAEHAPSPCGMEAGGRSRRRANRERRAG